MFSRTDPSLVRKPAWFGCGLVIGCLFLAVSCGYRFSGGASLPGATERVAVETFQNRTGEIGIEAVITNDIIYELTRAGKADISDKAGADAILRGVVRSAKSTTISHRTAHTSTERRITVSVDAQLVTPSGKVLWSVRNVTASEEYTVAGDKLATEQNKKSAVARLSGRLAQRMFYQMTSDF